MFATMETMKREEQATTNEGFFKSISWNQQQGTRTKNCFIKLLFINN